jgi:phosphoenolpyruvate-protein phosphotransferase
MTDPIRLAGVPGAPGIAIGPAWRFGATAASSSEPAVGSDGVRADDGRPPADAIRAASAETARQLTALAERIRGLGRDEEAAIFDAQALMAADPMLLDEAIRLAADGADVVDAADAVRRSADAAAAMLASIDDELLAARAADVRDVGARIVRVLRGETLALPLVPSVAIADDLPPSVTAEIPPGFLLGIALAGGSRTAHAVILARSLGIPAIVGVRGLLEAVGDATAGDGAVVVAVDGELGEVVVGPGPDDEAAFRRRAGDLEARRQAAAALRDRPAATADGERVMLVANIGTPADSARAIEAGAEGVGLFRTEFLFMSRQTPPTEDEQVAAYRQVLADFGPERPVVIRLADIGGDKAIPYLGLPPEQNPFLGVRAIRLGYANPDLLVTQLRAIWRAGAAAGVVPHVMAPMVATAGDVELLLALRDRAREALVAAGVPIAERLVTGIMVEVPSAALLAPELARMIDFFSIGTNDLTQYVLAADRGNAALASLQDALHPAVLRSVAGVVAGADAAGIPVAVCGELAGDPLGALVLVGLGVDELSADAGSLDGVRAALARVTRPQLDELARQALAAPDAEAVRELAAEALSAPNQPAT